MSVPRSTQLCSEKLLFLFLGHMLFIGKGIFQKTINLKFRWKMGVAPHAPQGHRKNFQFYVLIIGH